MNRKHYLLVEVAPRTWNRKPFMTKALLVFPGQHPPPSNWLPPGTLQAIVEIFGDELRRRLAERRRLEFRSVDCCLPIDDADGGE